MCLCNVSESISREEREKKKENAIRNFICTPYGRGDTTHDCVCNVQLTLCACNFISFATQASKCQLQLGPLAFVCKSHGSRRES